MNDRCTEFETTDDHFESIKISNMERFQQFMKILCQNKLSAQMSLRVIIDESAPGEPRIIDYEFFKREEQIKQSNKAFIGGIIKE